MTPLSLFNATSATCEDTFRLVRGINGILGDDALGEPALRLVFDKFWPDLESKLKSVPAIDAVPNSRRQEDKIDEILQRVRNIERVRFDGEPTGGLRIINLDTGEEMTDVARSINRYFGQLTDLFEHSTWPHLKLLTKKTPPPDE